MRKRFLMTKRFVNALLRFITVSTQSFSTQRHFIFIQFLILFLNIFLSQASFAARLTANDRVLFYHNTLATSSCSVTLSAPIKKKKKKPNCMNMWILQKSFSSILDGPQEDNAYSVEVTNHNMKEPGSKQDPGTSLVAQ